MASELIGYRRCPICGSAARLGLMKTQLACLVCNGCNTQTFARSGKSDELLRDLPAAEPARKVAPAEPAPTPEPVRTDPPAPAQAPARPVPVRTAPPTPKAAPAAEPEAPAWGWNAWNK